MITVQDAADALRNLVNRPDVQDQLLAGSQRWRQLCSSMDIIGDTECAAAAYLALPPMGDLGQLYLLAYGLFQVLFVQQDAVRHAAEAAGLAFELPEKLLEIRELRNDAIGHPTKRGSRNPESFGIVQMSLSYEGFTLYSFDWDEPEAFQPIRFKELIDTQAREVAHAIEKIIRHLEATSSTPR